MKCYNHPSEDAIGVCSKCGKGLCAVCARTIREKILCEKCSPLKAKPSKLRQYILVSAALGWLGSANIIFIGAYTAMYCLHLAVMLPIFVGRFQTEAYVVGILAAVSASTLVFGGYLIWRGRVRMGGILNLSAGIGTVLIYSYFVLPVAYHPPILRQFGVAGPLLCIPAVISGILGLMAVRLFKDRVEV